MTAQEGRTRIRTQGVTYVGIPFSRVGRSGNGNGNEGGRGESKTNRIGDNISISGSGFGSGSMLVS